MNRYARAHLSDDALHHSAMSLARTERGATADLLADLAEIDVRKFYLAMAYPSLFAYCVAELKLSDDAAYNRIKAARAARRFPVIFEAIADGRLNLTSVLLLRPYLTETTAADLLSVGMGKSKSDIEKLLAERYPRMDVPAFVAQIPVAPAPGRVDSPLGASEGASGEPELPATLVPALPGPGAAELLVPEPVVSSMRSKVKPLAPQRYEIHFTMSESCHEKLRYLQDLLGFDLPAGDLGQLFEDALDARIREVEKRKLAATNRPRSRPGQPSVAPRHIPAHVRRAVWKRDGGQCTFVSDTGRRCLERKGLQFDHVREVARGGEASVEGIRLLCHAHNQHQAERTFGAEFMRHKRIVAAEAREAKARAPVAAAPGA